MESEKGPLGTSLVPVDPTQGDRRIPNGTKFLARGNAADVWLVDIPDAHGQKYVLKAVRMSLESLRENLNPKSSKGAAELWETFTSVFLSKVEQWKALRHRHVISLFGLQAELVIYTEFCVNGTATQYLSQHPEDHINRRKSMISEVLAGVNYLHLQIPPIIHGCICMDKIFVDMYGRAKIGEFALSNLVEEFGLFVPSISQLSQIRWLSPELLDINSEDHISVPTVASDVWALGCTIFEIISGKLPYFKFKHDLRVRQGILSKELPGRSNNCLDTELSHFWTTLTQCWTWVPGERPTVDALVRLTTSEPLRAASNYEQNVSDNVFTTTTSTQFINLLTSHGCVDITSSIDFSLCSNSPVASGGLGDVFIGHLRTGTRVAIKVFRSYGESSELTGKYQKRAAREIHTWSKCQHPNVVELIGLTVFRECLAIVTKWEDNGNMAHYLSRNPTVNRCELSKSICAGILYLHNRDIAHGNLKGANVLIDHNGAPKLTDLGCVNFLSPTQHFTQTNIGPGYSVRWTAPEILQGKAARTKEGDIYALGMTILEAFTTEVPFSGWPEISLYQHVVDRKKKPLRPRSIIPERSVLGNVLWAILMSCWSYNPARRPTARTVHEAMVPLKPRLLEEIIDEPEGEDDD